MSSDLWYTGPSLNHEPETKALLAHLFSHLNLRTIFRVCFLQDCIACCTGQQQQHCPQLPQAPTGDASESCFPRTLSPAPCCTSQGLLLLSSGEYQWAWRALGAGQGPADHLSLPQSIFLDWRLFLGAYFLSQLSGDYGAVITAQHMCHWRFSCKALSKN